MLTPAEEYAKVEGAEELAPNGGVLKRTCQPGDGPAPVLGDQVDIKYDLKRATGMVSGGKSVDDGRLDRYTVGSSTVCKGLDVVLLSMREGERATSRLKVSFSGRSHPCELDVHLLTVHPFQELADPPGCVQRTLLPPGPGSTRRREAERGDRGGGGGGRGGGEVPVARARSWVKVQCRMLGLAAEGIQSNPATWTLQEFCVGDGTAVEALDLSVCGLPPGQEMEVRARAAYMLPDLAPPPDWMPHSVPRHICFGVRVVEVRAAAPASAREAVAEAERLKARGGHLLKARRVRRALHHYRAALALLDEALPPQRPCPPAPGPPPPGPPTPSGRADAPGLSPGPEEKPAAGHKAEAAEEGGEDGAEEDDTCLSSSDEGGRSSALGGGGSSDGREDEEAEERASQRKRVAGGQEAGEAGAEGARALRTALLLNIALAAAKLHHHSAAAAACSRVLEMEGGNVKALFRRGQARTALNDWEGARGDLAAALSSDHSLEHEVARELQRVLRAEAEHRARERSAFRGLFAPQRPALYKPSERAPAGEAFPVKKDCSALALQDVLGEVEAEEAAAARAEAARQVVLRGQAAGRQLRGPTNPWDRDGAKADRETHQQMVHEMVQQQRKEDEERREAGEWMRHHPHHHAEWLERRASRPDPALRAPPQETSPENRDHPD